MRQGADIYRTRCASCHDNPQGRTPPRATLTVTKSADVIIRALTTGAMRQIGATVGADGRAAVAAYLTGKPPGESGTIDINANRCAPPAKPFTLEGPSWNGWSGRGTTNARHQFEAGLSPADVARLKLKWVFAYPGGTPGPPTVVGGRVILPGASGLVMSLDAETGCTYWASDLGAQMRAAVSIGKLPSGRVVAFAGDMRGEVHALDASTGQTLWSTVVEDHPMVRLTGSVVYHDGRVYVPVSSQEERAASDPDYVCCTFQGSVVALDGVTGRILWKAPTLDEPLRKLADGRRTGPSGVAVWTAPTIDPKRGVLYVGTGNSYTEPAASTSDAVIAFDLKTGARRWVSQTHAGDAFMDGCYDKRHVNCPTGEVGPDFDLGGSPMLVTIANGQDRLLVASKSGMVLAMDPDRRGRILWESRAGRGGLLGGSEFGAASDGAAAYVPITDLGPAQTKANRGLPPAPGLHALSAATGRVLWRAPAPTPVCTWGQPCAPVMHAAPVVIPGVVFAGAFDGHERAYASADGRVLWDFDTGRSFEAVNGGKASGGSIDQGGQAVAGGKLFVSSGARNGYPGNALLVFMLDGK